MIKQKKETKKQQKIKEESLLVEETLESTRKKRELFNLSFTRLELIQLRDLLSIRLPPTYEKTLSQALAEKQQRVVTESSLWQKIGNACENAKIVVGDEAPDFIIGALGQPTLDVFEVSGDPSDMLSDDGTSTEQLFTGKNT